MFALTTRYEVEEGVEESGSCFSVHTNMQMDPRAHNLVMDKYIFYNLILFSDSLPTSIPTWVGTH